MILFKHLILKYQLRLQYTFLRQMETYSTNVFGILFIPSPPYFLFVVDELLNRMESQTPYFSTYIHQPTVITTWLAKVQG